MTQLDRGTWSERDLILELLRAGFKPGALFHDLYIKKHNGQNTQIDLVLATNVGLIVFEVKDYTGWIFGNGGQNQWTQVLAYGTIRTICATADVFCNRILWKLHIAGHQFYSKRHICHNCPQGAGRCEHDYPRQPACELYRQARSYTHSGERSAKWHRLGIARAPRRIRQRYAGQKPRV